VNRPVVDSLMLALGVMVCGRALDYHPDAAHLAVTTHGGRVYRIELVQLLELVSRGLVELDGDRCEVTGRGYDRWKRYSRSLGLRVRT
jgi:hypothetical protein